MQSGKGECVLPLLWEGGRDGLHLWCSVREECRLNVLSFQQLSLSLQRLRYRSENNRYQLSEVICIYDFAVYGLLFIYDLVIWLFCGLPLRKQIAP